MDRVVVAGGGLAGLRTVEALRRQGYGRRVTLVGLEHSLPYDRPPLSKDVLLGRTEPDGTGLRSAERLAELDVELVLGCAATGLDVAESTLHAGGRRIPYDALIVATGARPVTIPALRGVPGVHTLRTAADAAAIREAFESAREVAVVGAGFIGAEVAASARARGLGVTIVDMMQTPHAHVFGDAMARELLELHRAHGTRLRLGAAVRGADALPAGGVRLHLDDGAPLDADVVVVGVGVVPNVDWLRGSQLEVGDGVVCDASLAAAPGVYAVGDVANWPNPLVGSSMRVEHWNNAAEQARHAVTNLLEGTREPFLGSGFFWTDQYGVRIQCVGRATGDPVIVEGSVAERRFAAWYRDGDRVAGAIGMSAPRPVMAARRAIEAGQGWDEALRGSGLALATGA